MQNELKRMIAIIITVVALAEQAGRQAWRRLVSDPGFNFSGKPEFDEVG